LQQQLAFESIEFGFVKTLAGFVHHRQRFVKYGKPFLYLPRFPIYFS
jgi:hypothetical protein